MEELSANTTTMQLVNQRFKLKVLMLFITQSLVLLEVTHLALLTERFEVTGEPNLGNCNIIYVPLVGLLQVTEVELHRVSIAVNRQGTHRFS